MLVKRDADSMEDLGNTEHQRRTFCLVTLPAMYVHQCGCTPDFEATRIVVKLKQNGARELVEPFLVTQHEEVCTDG